MVKRASWGFLTVELYFHSPVCLYSNTKKIAEPSSFSERKQLLATPKHAIGCSKSSAELALSAFHIYDDNSRVI